MTAAVDAGRGLLPDPFPDDPWSWTRVVYRLVPDHPGCAMGSDGSGWCCRKSPRYPRGEWRRRRWSPGPKGYPTLVFTNREGRKVTKYVARWVMLTFMGPTPDGLEICHNDGIKTRNDVRNLRWDTHAANMADIRRHGTRRGSRGTSAKLNEVVVASIKGRLKAGENRRAIAVEFGVSKGTIDMIAQGKTWSHVECP